MVVRKPSLFALCLLMATLSAFSVAQDESTEAVKSENFLPASTTFWVSVPDVLVLKTKFDETDFGRLTNDSDMQPFIEAMTKQMRDWANEKNVRLGLTLDDIGTLESGEICVAGILQDAGAAGRNSHGMVFLVDVSASLDAAEELLEKVREQMDEKGAKKVEMEPINGSEVSKWTWSRRNPRTDVVREYTTIQTISNGWLLASDNEAIFRKVLRRVSNPDEGASLSSHPPFAKIQLETELENVKPQVRWFIDPFGYMRLADAIAAEERDFHQRKDNIGETLESQGFDAIKGFGGHLAFASEESDLVYRGFVYTPPRNVGEAQQRARGILDFRNIDEASRNPSKGESGDSAGGKSEEQAGPQVLRHVLLPERWVAEDCSGYSTFTWNAQSAFENVGEVFDAFVDPESEGDWDTMINGMSKDFDLDLRKMVSRLDNRFSIFSATEQPIDVRSERVAIGVKFTGDTESFFEMAQKLLPEGDTLEIGGFEMIVIDTTLEDEEGGDLNIEGGDDIFGDGGDSEDDVEEVEQFNLFEKRYVACVPAADDGDGGYLLICNNDEYLVKILERAKDDDASQLISSDDFGHVNAVLDSLIDPNLVSVRQFGRIDKILEANYEMMRNGNMAQSQTVLARVLNEIFKDPAADPDAVREQQIDGSTLPENYRESVAPFLGPSGYVMETKEDGWRITGVILKKNGGNEVVRKNDEEKKSRR